MMDKYRKDIDGLRSIAVMMVVLYHFGFSSITGGFVGVDVFFVISGFLITQILSKQILANTFSFKKFYIRRIKRLMPAMLAMVSVSFIVFSFVLVPSDYVMFSRSIIWVTGYLANIFFWKEYGGYFTGDTQESPLLHTWSLAVEEQFYLIWPIALIFCIRWLGYKKTIWATVIMTIALVVFSEIATQITIGAAYYLLPTRAFELMIGASLALSWTKLPDSNKPLTHVLSVAGMSAILYSAFTLTKADSFPGLNALFATVGTALLLYTNRKNQGVINKLISNKLCVFIGLISYSLYLWHWPIIVFVNYIGLELSLMDRLCLVVFSIGVAYLSYRFVEQPIRVTKQKPKITVLRTYILPSLVLVVCCSVVISLGGITSRFNDSVVIMDEAINSHSNVIREKCHSALAGANDAPDNTCLLGKLNASVKGFMFGDSHANHYTGFVDVLSNEEGVLVQDYTLDRCPPIFDLYWGKSKYKAERCKLRNDMAKRYSVDEGFDFIVLAASWPNERSTMIYDYEANHYIKGKAVEPYLAEKIESTIAFYANMNIKTVVITDTPFIVENKPNCPLKKELFNGGMECSIKDSPNDFLDQLLSKLSKKYKNLEVLSPRDVICSDGLCQLSLNGLPLYRDEDHLNDEGSRELGREFVKSNATSLVLSSKTIAADELVVR
jgi:peptidoglycan/LPS O-acetylase OafA/YrhL